MSSLAIPVSGQVLWSTGDVRLWTDIELLLRQDLGNYVADTFRVDTGTDLTTLPAYHARLLGLPMPAHASPGVTHRPTGLEIRSGVLRFRVVGMDPTEYAVPCLFLGDPAVPPVATHPAIFPKKLVQPIALLDHLRFTFTKDLAGGSLYGDLVIDKR